MYHLLIVASIALLFSTTANAQAGSRAMKAERLANAIGLVQELETAKQSARTQAEAQVATLLRKLSEAKVPPEVIAEARSYADEYAKNIESSWNGTEATAVYVSTLAEVMTEAEIDAAIAYYSAPEGKKARESILAASSRLSDYIDSKNSAAEEAETDRFVARVVELQNKAASKSKKLDRAPH